MQLNPVSKLSGTVNVPGDKSISHRSIMFGALAKGTTQVTGFLNGADCLSTAHIFQQMGVQINFIDETTFTLDGLGLHGLVPPTTILDVGNSGTTMRLLSGILAGQNFSSTLTGDASILTRPMNRVIDPLQAMGASIRSKNENGLAPLLIEPSQLKGITYRSKVASAQVKSCILLATLYANSPSTIIEPCLSRNHSELMLKSLGADLHSENAQVTIQPNPILEATTIDIPGDISSAAYFLVAGLIIPNSDILLTNVGINPTRDGIIRVLKDMNGSIEYINERTINEEKRADIRIRSSRLTATTIGGDIIPTLIDEIPAIAVAACFAEGTTIIKDAEELKVKESNRIDTMVTELKKMHASIEATDDGMIIEGRHQLSGASLKSYHDHRIAMSLSIAALAAYGSSTLHGSQCIDISYPRFFDDIQQLCK
jgi:3-phosphoshikimate 1-carboxyvinyltransferase